MDSDLIKLVNKLQDTFANLGEQHYGLAPVQSKMPDTNGISKLNKAASSICHNLLLYVHRKHIYSVPCDINSHLQVGSQSSGKSSVLETYACSSFPHAIDPSIQ